MSVRRNHRGKWIVDIVYTHIDGREQRITRTSPVQSRRGAERFERQVRQALLDGTYQRKEEEQEAPAMPTLAGFVDERWLPTYPAAAGNRPCTVKARKWALKHIKAAVGHLPLDRINAEEVERFAAILRGEDKALSPKSVKEILGALRRVLVSAVEWEVIDHLPRFPKVKVPQQDFDWFTPEESRRLLEASTDEEGRVMLLCALHTGVRAGELVALEWRDLDWDRREVVIRRNKPASEKRAGPTKNGRIRRIPMTGELEAGLRRIRHLRGPLVFCRPDGSYLLEKDRRRVLSDACKGAGLRRVRWHDLRHTMASQAVARGVPLPVVQSWLGHTTITMTMRYAHLSPDVGREWIKVLEEDAAPREHGANISGEGS